MQHQPVRLSSILPGTGLPVIESLVSLASLLLSPFTEKCVIMPVMNFEPFKQMSVLLVITATALYI